MIQKPKFTVDRLINFRKRGINASFDFNGSSTRLKFRDRCFPANCRCWDDSRLRHDLTFQRQGIRFLLFTSHFFESNLSLIFIFVPFLTPSSEKNKNLRLLTINIKVYFITFTYFKMLLTCIPQHST